MYMPSSQGAQQAVRLEAPRAAHQSWAARARTRAAPRPRKAGSTKKSSKTPTCAHAKVEKLSATLHIPTARLPRFARKKAMRPSFTA